MEVDTLVRAVVRAFTAEQGSSRTRIKVVHPGGQDYIAFRREQGSAGMGDVGARRA